MTLEKAIEKVHALMKTLKENKASLSNLEVNEEMKKTSITNEYTGKKKPYQETIAASEEELQKICDMHPELFENGTLVTPHGAVGYRNNPPSVTIEDEKEAISFFESARKKIFSSFLKVKTTIDKTAIKKALHDKKVTEDELAGAGVEIVAERVFKYAIDKKEI